MKLLIDTNIIVDIFETEVEDLKTQDLRDALKLRFRDYEDALQSACAERIGADYIITHNVKDFEKSNVPAITPEDFLKRIVVSS